MQTGREIKFRAWDKNLKMMLSLADCYGNGIYLSFDGKIKRFLRGMDLDQNVWENKLELMQFTGLHDKNGKEIYEGDILHLHTEEQMVIRNFVEDVYHLICFLRERPKPPIKIIGNIYENPELLK